MSKVKPITTQTRDQGSSQLFSGEAVPQNSSRLAAKTPIPQLIVWFNRLSDFLYLLARFEEGQPLYVKDTA